MERDFQTHTSEKPGVAGTQQVHTAVVSSTAQFSEKCAVVGVTTVVGGAILMAAWKGLTKWLG